jgi:DNA (cytosine-5)-methyltransferase 3A
MENVASMTNKDRDTITNELREIFPDLKMLKIDSALLAPAHRRRLYWTNIPNVTVPQPSGKSYQDILVNGYADREKANVLLSSDVTLTNGIKRYYDMNIGNIIFKDKHFAELPPSEKLLKYPAILKRSGYISKKGLIKSQYDFPNGCYRVPSILERERMMTFPDGYVNDVPKVPKSEKKKILGLSYTIDVVVHLLGFLKNH